MFHFDDKDLKLVLAVDRCGNISEAARTVHLAVSSASARLGELESRLDVRLFERRSHGVRTTPAGEVFVRHARKMILEAEALVSDTERFRRSNTALRIASNVNALASFLPGDVGRFMTAHPDLSVMLTHFSRASELLAHVALGESDLGVTASPGDFAGLRFLPYETDRLTVLCPLDHPLTKLHRPVRFTEALEYEYIGLTSDFALERIVEEKAAEAGISPRIRMRVGFYATARLLVTTGVGFTIQPAGCVPADFAGAMLELDEPWSLRELKLCVREGTLATKPEVGLLIDSLRECSAERQKLHFSSQN